MRQNKAQGSLMDILFGILIASIILLMVHYNYANAQQGSSLLRLERAYNRALLLSVLNYNANNQTVFELLGLYACKGSEQLNVTIWNIVSEKIGILKKPGSNYIFYLNATNSLVVYDKQPRVCLSEISIESANISTPCGNGAIFFGTWPSYEQVSEDC